MRVPPAHPLIAAYWLEAPRVLVERIEGKWIDTFVRAFTLCRVQPGDEVAILSETQSRAVNVHLAELALLRLGAKPFHLVMPSPP